MSATSASSIPGALDMNLVERVNVGDIVLRAADVYPDRVAVIEGERRLTYADFNTQVDRLGQWVRPLGVEYEEGVVCLHRWLGVGAWVWTTLHGGHATCAATWVLFAPFLWA